jgi:hypothetical protein
MLLITESRVLGCLQLPVLHCHRTLQLLFPASNIHYLLVSTHGSFNDTSVCGKVEGW